jgi:SurA N-terminal domain
MFDFVRKHTRIMQFLLFLLIFPSFVLFGLDGYNRFKEKGEPVASVDGQDISRSEWDAAHKTEVDRLRSSMPSLDPKLLDSPEARYATLERLVRDRVLQAAAVKSGLVTSDARLARDLQENPTIASLRRPDGTLDMEKYKQLVGSQGMTPEMFEARVRSDLSIRQVMAGISGTGFAPILNAVKSRLHGSIRPTSPARSRRLRLIWKLFTRPIPNCSRLPNRPTSSTWCWTSTRSGKPSRSTRQTSRLTTTITQPG